MTAFVYVAEPSAWYRSLEQWGHSFNCLRSFPLNSSSNHVRIYISLPLLTILAIYLLYFRILFYYVIRAGNGRLTLKELKRGNLIDAMQHAGEEEEEEDITKVLR